MELKRPIQLLYPLEVSSPPEVSTESVETSAPRNEELTGEKRPRRAAASEARDRMLACHLDEND